LPAHIRLDLKWLTVTNYYGTEVFRAAKSFIIQALWMAPRHSAKRHSA